MAFYVYTMLFCVLARLNDTGSSVGVGAAHPMQSLRPIPPLEAFVTAIRINASAQRWFRP